jgi:hypothetical protein
MSAMTRDVGDYLPSPSASIRIPKDLHKSIPGLPFRSPVTSYPDLSRSALIRVDPR